MKNRMYTFSLGKQMLIKTVLVSKLGMRFEKDLIANNHKEIFFSIFKNFNEA